MAMRFLQVMHTKLERSEAEFTERLMAVLHGLELIQSRVVCPAKESGLWRLILKIKTCSSLALIPRVCTSFRAHPRTFRRASNRIHQIEKENAGESARGVFLFEGKCNVSLRLRALTCVIVPCTLPPYPAKRRRVFVGSSG